MPQLFVIGNESTITLIEGLPPLQLFIPDFAATDRMWSASLDGGSYTWGPVEYVSTAVHPFKQASCTVLGDDLHMVLVTNGEIWHDIRYGANRTLQGQNQVAGLPGTRFFDISCAAVGGDLHVVAYANGAVFHNIRFGHDGSWQGFLPIPGTIGRAFGSVFQGAITCASVGDDLHVVGIIQGNAWHNIRYGDRSWQGFAHVHGPNNEGHGDITSVACASTTGGELQVIGLVHGAVWHALRNSQGTWTAFNQPGINGESINDPSRPFNSISCCGVNPIFHIVAIRCWVDEGVGVAPIAFQDGFHVMRAADGVWNTPDINSLSTYVDEGDGSPINFMPGPVACAMLYTA